MRPDVHAKAALHQLKKRQAWQATMEAAKPQVMVTLGTNKPLDEAKLLADVSRAMVELDTARLGDTRRLEKKSALSRVAGFILPEKIGLNAHAHMLIYSPSTLLLPESGLIRRIAETRIRRDFIGLGVEYDADLHTSDQYRAPRLERIWREHVPGAHYHARWVDAGMSQGVDYVLKELRYHSDRDVRLTQEFWSERQRNMNLTLPIDQDLRPRQ